MDFFCSFCLKLEDEANQLIELSSNLLFIDKSHYDFPHVFQNLYNITSDDLRSNFICESCKDSTVQFFVFKKGVVSQMNPHRKMIFSQVEDFLKTKSKNIDQIKVLRTLDTITLQYQNVDEPMTLQSITENTNDEEICEVNETNFEEELSEPEEIIEELDLESSKMQEEEVVVMVSSCSKCDEVATNNAAMEIHEFLKHSIIGLHIESEAENSQELIVTDGESKFIQKCFPCSLEFEDQSSQILHIFAKHCREIIDNVNEVFSYDTSFLDEKAINTYINFIGDLMQINESKQDALSCDEYAKQYFFNIYSADEAKTEVDASQFESIEIESDEGIPMKMSSNDQQLVEAEKTTSDVTDMSKEWIRNEIAQRKTMIQNSNGVSRPVYQCAYCEKHSSNSASGFRYHLVSKHLKDKNFDDTQVVTRSHSVVDLRSQRTKNICTECSLKFKDQKLLLAHRSCHDLLSVISEYYQFPSCSSCNALFIDETTLNLHLANHDNDIDVMQPIVVPYGEIVMLGKIIEGLEPKDVSLTEGFPWSCGHCALKFIKESDCRFHLLMFHTQSFECPVDKRTFSGFKSVSLFCHHLKNKHSEIFPDLSFPCTFCKTEFSSIYEKLSHMKRCSFKKFSCDHCGKKFFKKSDLVAHLKFVSGEITFPCKVCDKVCETFSDLKIHLRSHTKEKPFDCSLCDKNFRTLAARAAHMEAHNTNNVKYNCFCGKLFKQRQMYRRHMKAIHENNPNQKGVSY